MSKTTIKTNKDEEFTPKRERAMVFDQRAIKELVERNASKSFSRTFATYTKELLRGYITSPIASQDSLREISRFLCRYSMLYKKLLMYYASMPLFYYNIIPELDIQKLPKSQKMIKDYMSVLRDFDTLDIPKEGYNAGFLALRDGFCVEEMYDSGENGKFLLPLDVQYCRIYGKTPEGQWIVYFNAAYFDKGNNSELIYGINGDGVGAWSDVHKNGYEKYREEGRDYQWYRLDPETTFCLTTCPEDEFYAPLPFFLPLFELILDDLDLQQLINDRTALENYILLISKVPLKKDSDMTDDFAVSDDIVLHVQELLNSAIPDLVGTVWSPMEIEKIEFPKSNTTEANDELAKSINNIFNNAGASQLVVSGGASTNSVGLKHALQNDASNTWMLLANKFESWLNYYIKHNISEGYLLKIHKITWYNETEYQEKMKSSATLGGSAMDYLTSLGDKPSHVLYKLNFENIIGVKSLMVPLNSTYTQSSSGGAPTKNEDDLSSEGLNTREGNKNEGSRENS